MAVRRVSIPAAGHGGAQVPTLQVVHDIECPLREGYAESTGQMFTRTTEKSAHKCVGPEVVVECLPLTVIAWHVGPNGNRGTIGYEQCGYVTLTRAQWLTGAGAQQLDNLAAELAADGLKYGIPDRHLTDAQLAHWAANGRRAVDGGRVTHDQIHRVLGGTTHTDPTPNYPLDVLNAAVTRHRNGGADMPQLDATDLANIRKQIDASVKYILPRGLGMALTGAGNAVYSPTDAAGFAKTSVKAQLGAAIYLLMYGDNSDDAKDVHTHPNNLQELRALVLKMAADGAAREAALLEAIRGIAGGDLDMTAVEAAAERGASDALARVSLVVDPPPVSAFATAPADAGDVGPDEVPAFAA